MARQITLPNLDFIAGVGGRFEPVRKNFFLLRLAVPQLSASLQPYLELSLSKCTLPKSECTVLGVKVGNETRYVPEFGKTDPLTVSYKDYTNGFAANTFWAWHLLVRDAENGRIGSGATSGGDQIVKANGNLILFAPGGSPVSEVRRWNLKGVFPSKIDFGDADMSSTDQVEISVTLSVDYIIQENISDG